MNPDQLDYLFDLRAYEALAAVEKERQRRESGWCYGLPVANHHEH